MARAEGKGRTGARSDGGEPLVLIVEDEALIAWDLADACRDEQLRVAGPFASCAEAFNFLKAQVPDAAILDAVLTDGSCLELALDLRKRGVPLVIYSGASDVVQSPELEGALTVEKPSPAEVVVLAVRKLLSGQTKAEQPEDS